MKSRLRKHFYIIALISAVILYILYFTTASFLRHENFYTGRYDLGNMDQVVWNTINGRVFQSNSSLGLINSRLSGHADFILIFLSPFYLIWNDPRMLLILQTVTIALGAVFIYLIAKKIVGNSFLSFVVSFIFLLNPGVQFANLYDFHPVTLAATFLLGAFYFFLSKKYLLFFIFCILAGLTKEQVWLIVSIFGIFFLFSKVKRELIIGLLLFCGGLFLFYYLIWYAIPQARGSNHFALEYYAEFGDSPNDIVKNMIVSPIKIVSTFFQESQRTFLFQLLLPVGFLPLLSPHMLLFAFPDLLINLLSNNAQLRQIHYHYATAITPFLFIATIFSLRRLLNMHAVFTTKTLSIYLLAAAFFTAYSFGPLPGAKKPNIDMITKPYANKAFVEKTLATIPEEATVAATNNIGAHLAHREVLYTIPIGVDKAEYIVFLLNDSFAQPSLNAQEQMAEYLKNDDRYVLVAEKDDFIVFKLNKK